MVEKFKFWCHKVLPTIYDDSLSYYEAICKMATYLNATIDQVNEFQKMIDALPETILNSEEFQKMVQDAVDGKIDALYKVVQDALDAFEQEQDAFEKQVNESNAAFKQQVNADNAQFKSQVNADNTKFKNDVNSANTQFQQQVNSKLSGYESSNAQFQQQVNNKLTGYETSDAQFKKEVNNKLSGYESDNAQFKSQVNAKVDEIPTKIAEYPKYPLCQNSNGAVTQEFDVAMTYYHNDNLIYGNYHTPFNTSAAAQSGKYEIDCSSFVQLCLMGVPYENTRWFNDKNAAVSGYYFGDDLIIDPEADRPYGMLSDDMCKWFVEHGYYFETDDPSQLKPGDVVFMTFNDESPTYKHVTHCGLFVSYQAITDEVWCISASNTSDARPKVVSRESYKRTSPSFVGFGRLPLPDCGFDPQNLLDNGQQTLLGLTGTLSPSNRYVDSGRFRLNETLKPNKMYTLVARLESSSAKKPVFFTLQSGSTNLTNLTFTDGEWIFMPFVLNFQNTPEVHNIPIDTGTHLYLLSLYARILTTETSTINLKGTFTHYALYEGVVISPIERTLDMGTVPSIPLEACMIMRQPFELGSGLIIPNDGQITAVLSSSLNANYVKKNVLSCMPVRAVATTAIEPGYYLLFTFADKLSSSATRINGCQYLVGVSNGVIYARTANEGAWGTLTKIAPYTPTP